MGEQTCTVQYVSNAGLVFRAGGQGLGIDIFCQDSQHLYQDTPLKLQEELLAEIEEGSLETLIFTHEHEDHFCEANVVEAWKRNPKLRVISTERVIQGLGQAGVAEQALKAVRREKIREKPLFLQLGHFRVGFLDGIHEGAQYAQVQNLCLLLETEGKRWIVPGDAAPEEGLFEKTSRWSKEVDCFFAPFPYVGLKSARGMLERTLAIRRLFVLHQPRREADAQNWVENTKKMCLQAKDGLPMPYFPEEMGKIYEL